MYQENSKITSKHLAKKGIVYLRQSTQRQVRENSESTLRQYSLVNRLVELGWPSEQINVIDQDLGTSGTDSGRNGFQSLVADVSNGLVGAVACIECSRLSRDSEDWIRLTKFCAYTDTLLIDADGVYDPNNFNDRLLLGLKGTMSEAELHILQERMHGGLINKAERGDLMVPLPPGYIYDNGQIIKNPDLEVQKAVELLFEVFRRVGSACQVAQHYRDNRLEFPRRRGNGFDGDAEWCALDYATALRILHNPFYAGVYCYGKTRTIWTAEGSRGRKVPRGEWRVFIRDHHAQYISFEEFEANEQIIADNRMDAERERTPPREGPALLQGIVYCGKCGNSMVISYQQSADKLTPVYQCSRDHIQHRGDMCQIIPGKNIDQKISEILVAKLTPEAIEQAVCVQKELDNRQAQTLTFFQIRVDRCEYEAGLARKRYMSVDPDNRLVALQLEASWNKTLAELENAKNELVYQDEAVKKSKKERDYLSLKYLSQSFSETFLSDAVSYRDKKRIVRYLIEDVTLLRESEKILIQVRFKGNTTQVIEIDATLPAYKLWATDPEVVRFIDAAAESYCDEEIAGLLNKDGYTTGKGFAFTKASVRSVMSRYSIPNMKKRYMDRGYITVADKASAMGIWPGSLHYWIHSGKYQGEYIIVNTKNEILFPPLKA